MRYNGVDENNLRLCCLVGADGGGGDDGVYNYSGFDPGNVYIVVIIIITVIIFFGRPAHSLPVFPSNGPRTTSFRQNQSSGIIVVALHSTPSPDVTCRSPEATLELDDKISFHRQTINNCRRTWKFWVFSISNHNSARRVRRLECAKRSDKNERLRWPDSGPVGNRVWSRWNL